MHTALEAVSPHVLQRYAIVPAVHTAVQGPPPLAGSSDALKCGNEGLPLAATRNASHSWSMHAREGFEAGEARGVLTGIDKSTS